MRRFLLLASTAAVALIGGALAAPAVARPRIAFGTPSIVDPIHTNGEPDVGIDKFGRVFVSGPTGTGTQRSTWFGSVDRGHTFRPISPGPAPSALQSFEAPPGGGDTDIAFDRRGKQYFSDLYALVCLRSATTPDAGATVFQSIYPAGCSGVPGADRQWLAVYDPPPGTPKLSAYTGPKPLIYQEYNDLVSNGGNGGAQWVKSNSAVDSQPGGPGLNYVNAQQDGPGTVTGFSPFGADGYPAIDQVTGKVFQAAGRQNADGKTYSLLLNIGTPNSAGDLKFLDAPGATTKLIPIAQHLQGSPGVLFSVVSMDRARNLHVVWALDDGTGTHPGRRQVFVSAASAASGWRKWTAPVQVSDGSTATGDAVNVFPWIKAGGAGRADAVWYGSNKRTSPSSKSGQAWNVFMAQVVYPTARTGAVTGARPTVRRVKVSPHPMHYQDICLEGAACIASQGNRNLADFFEVTIDKTGAAEVVYPDTSNGLAQPGFTPANQQFVDHAGAGVITLARQSSGPGLFGRDVRGRSSAPRSGLTDGARDALYPVHRGTNVSGLDILGHSLRLSGGTLTVRMKVLDLAHPSQTASRIPNASFLQYLTRWQMGNRLYYAAMETTSSGRIFYAGATQSVDLCSVSACFPHVLIYPEPGGGGATQPGSINCPSSPSVASPCTLTIKVRAADVGRPTRRSVLAEVGAYALATSHQDRMTTNPQAQADNVPLEVDGVCCYNYSAFRPAARHHRPPAQRPRHHRPRFTG